MAMLLTLQSCSVGHEEYNFEILQQYEGDNIVISFDSTEEYVCIPDSDLSSPQGRDGVNSSVIGKPNRIEFSRGDALSYEGGASNSFKFYVGKSEIYLRRDSRNNEHYSLRLLSCADLFSRKDVVRGYLLVTG
jgi:hypothetical protein